MFDCPHTSRNFEREELVSDEIMYLYVCHDCQSGFYSTQPPRRFDYKDLDFFDFMDEYNEYALFAEDDCAA